MLFPTQTPFAVLVKKENKNKKIKTFFCFLSSTGALHHRLFFPSRTDQCYCTNFMGNKHIVRRLRVKRLLYSVGVLTAVLGLLHLVTYPYENYSSILSSGNVGLVAMTNSSRASTDPKLSASDIIQYQENDEDYPLSSPSMRKSESPVEIKEKDSNQGSMLKKEENLNSRRSAEPGQYGGKINTSKAIISGFSEKGSLVSTNTSAMANSPKLRKRRVETMSIAQMDSLLINSSIGKKSKRRRWSSPCERELQDAQFQIGSAPIQRNVSEDHASLFRNYSMFKRSYELMESTLKVYVYREGEKPIFHQPYMRGIYASEGWFMKLMERNKQFVVKDPKKAHLFYLPFSSVKLRNALNSSGFVSQNNLENHLKNYVDKIATKYHFWSKRGGADHFLVACHDWAPRFTRNIFGNCIRALCNSNIARGFKIGKDVSLPVTYIRSAENPLKDIGGNPSVNRPILAFFAGGMHGYVRPILLRYWANKEPDMKIIGPMVRDIEGKARYREFMKSSKYCICAKGYEVHTPRVVESIYYECVPVIISDNYVPPFFEVLKWESFALFVAEDDIPNLRDVLLSVSEERYQMMRRRLKIVQQYFLWHKIPERYDLFHMILHSIWYNRVFQGPT